MSFWEHTITGVDWTQFKLHEREQLFQHLVLQSGYGFDQPPFAITWEDPADPEAPIKIVTPSPVWWAMALHGGILPPVQVYWALAHDEAQPGFERHHRGHLLHETPPMEPMTPEQAMEYLVMKELPPHVWRDYKGNRTILKIVKREMIPADRMFRDAWRMKQEEAAHA